MKTKNIILVVAFTLMASGLALLVARTPALLPTQRTVMPTNIITYPTPILSPKPKPTLTPFPTLTTPTKTNTPTLTPLPFAYETKDVLINYYSIGPHTLFDSAGITEFSNLVVYTDGQIITNGETKKLSPDEMEQFFAQLKKLGFYNIETDEQGQATPNLYTSDNPFKRIYDADSYCIFTTTQGKERNICAYEPYMQYLIPAMRHTLNFLDNYHPKGMEPYSPDRILLYVESPETSQVLDRDALSKKRVVPWPADLPPLKPNLDYKVTYIQGPMVAKILSYFENLPGSELPLFQQNGINYFVDVDILLPHEEVNFNSVQW